MAYYLVNASPVGDLLAELTRHLEDGTLAELKPFGPALVHGLQNARRRRDGRWTWEEEDYCTPPLKQERQEVFSRYFRHLTAERVEKGAGWERIRSLPPVFGEGSGDGR